MSELGNVLEVTCHDNETTPLRCNNVIPFSPFPSFHAASIEIRIFTCKTEIIYPNIQRPVYHASCGIVWLCLYATPVHELKFDCCVAVTSESPLADAALDLKLYVQFQIA